MFGDWFGDSRVGLGVHGGCIFADQAGSLCAFAILVCYLGLAALWHLCAFKGPGVFVRMPRYT